MLGPLWSLLADITYHSDIRIAFHLRQRKEQILLRKHQWRTPLVSDLQFDARTAEAVCLAETLSGVTEPISVNWLHVHVLAEVEEDDFHASGPGTSADNDVCLLSDTLEAMLVEESPDHKEHAGVHATISAAVASESIPMPHRELLMSDINPVSLTVERYDGVLTSFSYNPVYGPHQHHLVVTPCAGWDVSSSTGILHHSRYTR